MGNRGGVERGGEPQTELGKKGWGGDHFTPLNSA